MRPSRRLVHSSDLHLEVAGDRRCRGLSHVVDFAIEHRADALLIAGDFFDHNRVRDEVVAFAVAELMRFGGDVFIAAGNHDCLAVESVYCRDGLWEPAENIHVFSAEGEAVHAPEIGLEVWGRSLATYGDGPSPIAVIPEPYDPEGCWQVGVAHGYYNPPGHRNWASFCFTPEEIAASGRHYLAFGDNHAFIDLSQGEVRACYSGAPSSGTHTVSVIDLDGATGEVRFRAESLRERYPA